MTWRFAVSAMRSTCAVSERVRAYLESLCAGILALLPALSIGADEGRIDYVRDVQPLFDRYCVACHACFDAPCQLDLTHAEGVARGASKQPVYDGARLEAAMPTRLFVDARSVAEWREKGFFPVVEGRMGKSLLSHTINLPRSDDWRAGGPVPDAYDIGISRENSCVSDLELAQGNGRDVHAGMPFALPRLAAEEIRILDLWVAQGARLPSSDAGIPDPDRPGVERWEAWLNAPGLKRRLLARWLFEHWAIARLHFDESGSRVFYRLVRSRTPMGEPVDEIATRHANSDPGAVFYYRLQPQRGTRVYKTHITFALNEAVRERIEALFFATDWQIAELPGYSDEERANPFTTFSALPAGARYRFMLEHAGYFVRTFIRGPVCRGQLATDVIRDQFWVMFQSPESDPYIGDAAYRGSVARLLALPGIEQDLLDGARQWIESTRARNDYLELRAKELLQMSPGGASIADIWDGDGNNHNALLSVFRHHDSASLIRGWLGQQPLTVWWLDFPLFERSYYNLVVNFDVFGSVAHQAQTRLYFDLIRNGAEQNFLRLLPAGKRQAVLDDWYAGSGKLKMWLSYHAIDDERPSAVEFTQTDVQRELLTRLLARFTAVNATPDPLNRDPAALADPIDATLAALAGTPASRMPAILQLPEASVLRIFADDGKRRIYTLLRNRRHSNVAFVLGESLRYVPEQDTLTIAGGIATAYPNYLFNVPVSQLHAFVEALRDPGVANRERYLERVVEPWGVRRTDPGFWDLFHDTHAWLRESDPVEAAGFDLNRYLGD